MQWESGRTRRTLLQVVRESKAKRQNTSSVLSSDLSLNICPHRTGPILPCQCSPGRTRTTTTSRPRPRVPTDNEPQKSTKGTIIILCFLWLERADGSGPSQSLSHSPQVIRHTLDLQELTPSERV